MIWPPCMGEASCGGVPVGVVLTDLMNFPLCAKCLAIAQSRPPHPGYILWRVETGDRAELLLHQMRDQRPS